MPNSIESLITAPSGPRSRAVAQAKLLADIFRETRWPCAARMRTSPLRPRPSMATVFFVPARVGSMTSAGPNSYAVNFMLAERSSSGSTTIV